MDQLGKKKWFKKIDKRNEGFKGIGMKIRGYDLPWIMYVIISENNSLVCTHYNFFA